MCAQSKVLDAEARIEPKNAKYGGLALGRLISFGFRKGASRRFHARASLLPLPQPYQHAGQALPLSRNPTLANKHPIPLRFPQGRCRFVSQFYAAGEELDNPNISRKGRCERSLRMIGR